MRFKIFIIFEIREGLLDLNEEKGIALWAKQNVAFEVLSIFAECRDLFCQILIVIKR